MERTSTSKYVRPAGRTKKNPAIHIAGFEAVSIRRKKLIQKETTLSI